MVAWNDTPRFGVNIISPCISPKHKNTAISLTIIALSPLPVSHELSTSVELKIISLIIEMSEISEIYFKYHLKHNYRTGEMAQKSTGKEFGSQHPRQGGLQWSVTPVPDQMPLASADAYTHMHTPTY